MEKSRKLGHRKGSGIAGNPECVGGWCSVLCGGDRLRRQVFACAAG